MMTLDTVIATLRQSGTQDMSQYREGIARRTGATLAEVDAAIAAADPAPIMSPEACAQQHLRQVSQYGRDMIRAMDHEED